MLIRIIKTPHGEKLAPESVRECWVGMKLKSLGRLPNDFCVLIGEKMPNGYQVDGATALKALKLYNKEEAYKWWIEHHPEMALQSITFCPDVCEPVPLSEMTSVELLEEYIARTTAYYLKDVRRESAYKEEKAAREVAILLITGKAVPSDLIAWLRMNIENKVRAELCIEDARTQILAVMTK